MVMHALGDTLDAIQDAKGTVWVSLRRCCENLGLSLETQRRKLIGKPWATAAEMSAVAEDGKMRSITMLDLDTLPGWLFSIDARKVKEQLREKLARYQKECARVLRDHFLGASRPNPGSDLRDLVTTIVAECLAPILTQIQAAATPQIVVPPFKGGLPGRRCRERSAPQGEK